MLGEASHNGLREALTLWGRCEARAARTAWLCAGCVVPAFAVSLSVLGPPQRRHPGAHLRVRAGAYARTHTRTHALVRAHTLIHRWYSILLVFFVSAVFHELVLGVPLHVSGPSSMHRWRTAACTGALLLLLMALMLPGPAALPLALTCHPCACNQCLCLHACVCIWCTPCMQPT